MKLQNKYNEINDDLSEIDFDFDYSEIDDLDYEINSINRGQWIQDIMKIKSKILNTSKNRKIVFRFGANVIMEKFEPMMLVSLACLFKHMNNNGYNIDVIFTDRNLSNYLFSDLEIGKYFNENATHVHIIDKKILNLWKIDTRRSAEYNNRVALYFEGNFKTKDLSALKKSLDEIYANIGDHSNSEDLAYSFIRLDDKTGKIYFAACDFGLGIPTTLRNSGKEYDKDTDALLDSVKLGVSANSKIHNRGFGLNNILSMVSDEDCLRIVSKKALLHCEDDIININTYELDFDFNGCLIYFELDINKLPDLESLDTGLSDLDGF